MKREPVGPGELLSEILEQVTGIVAKANVELQVESKNIFNTEQIVAVLAETLEA